MLACMWFTVIAHWALKVKVISQDQGLRLAWMVTRSV